MGTVSPLAHVKGHVSGRVLRGQHGARYRLAAPRTRRRGAGHRPPARPRGADRSGPVTDPGPGHRDAGRAGDRAASKLACARGLRAETATSSLGEVPGVPGADEDDLYAAMDWALARKDAAEAALAARHLRDGALVLYDVSSTAFEGRTCFAPRRSSPSSRTAPSSCACPAFLDHARQRRDQSHAPSGGLLVTLPVSQPASDAPSPALHRRLTTSVSRAARTSSGTSSKDVAPPRSTACT